MPPRHGKSEMISKFFPFWYLWNFPHQRIILTSYNSHFAELWGSKVRDLIKFTTYPNPALQISSSSKSKAYFEIDEFGGSMSCVGALGSITGKGADLLIIDDPVKNDQDARSSLKRDNLWEWFISTVMTRLEPNGIVVLVMTRWHEDDLCGRILAKSGFISYDNDLLKKISPEEQGEKWILIKLPALAEEGDTLGRLPGEALWADRYSLENLEQTKRSIGSYWFSGLYQQNPLPDGDSIFKRKYFRYFTQDDEFYYLLGDNPDAVGHFNRKTVSKTKCNIYFTIDLAVTSKETSDYTVVVVSAITPENDVLILDVFREKFDGSEHIKMIENLNNRWKPQIIGIESVQYQLALIQTLNDKSSGMIIKELKADKDKVSRALPMCARMEAGKVYFLHESYWLASFEEELLKFPKARKNDQVDAFAYITTMIYNRSDVMPTSRSLKIGISVN